MAIDVHAQASLEDYRSVLVKWVPPPSTPEVPSAMLCAPQVRSQILAALGVSPEVPTARLQKAFPASSELYCPTSSMRFRVDASTSGRAPSSWGTMNLHKRPLVTLSVLHAAVATPAAAAALRQELKAAYGGAVHCCLLFAGSKEDAQALGGDFAALPDAAPDAVSAAMVGILERTAAKVVSLVCGRLRALTTAANVADVKTANEGPKFEADVKKDPAGFVRRRAAKLRADYALFLGAPEAAIEALSDAPHIARDPVWAASALEALAAARFMQLSDLRCAAGRVRPSFSSWTKGDPTRLPPRAMEELRELATVVAAVNAAFQAPATVATALLSSDQRRPFKLDIDAKVKDMCARFKTIAGAVLAESGEWSEAVAQAFEAVVGITTQELHFLLADAIEAYRRAQAAVPLTFELEAEALLRRMHLHAQAREVGPLQRLVHDLARHNVPDKTADALEEAIERLWITAGAHRRAALYAARRAQKSKPHAAVLCYDDALRRAGVPFAVDWRKGTVTYADQPDTRPHLHALLLTGMHRTITAAARQGPAWGLDGRVLCQLAAFIVAHYSAHIAPDTAEALMASIDDAVRGLPAIRLPVPAALPLLRHVTPLMPHVALRPRTAVVRRTLFISGGPKPVLSFRGRDLPHDVAWVAGELHSSAVHLFNPFRWAMDLSDMRLVATCDGAPLPDTQQLARAVRVPSRTSATVDIQCRPPTASLLEITAVRCRWRRYLGQSQPCATGADGSPGLCATLPLAVPLQIPVLRPLPRLDAAAVTDAPTEPEPVAGLQGTGLVAMASAVPTPAVELRGAVAAVTAWTGQRVRVLVRATNTSSTAVDTLSVRAHYGGCTTTSCDGCTVQRSSTESARPLCAVRSATEPAAPRPAVPVKSKAALEEALRTDAHITEALLPLPQGGELEVWLECDAPAFVDAPSTTDVEVRLTYGVAFEAPEVSLAELNEAARHTPIPQRVATATVAVRVEPGLSVGAVHPSHDGRFVAITCTNASATSAIAVRPPFEGQVAVCGPHSDVTVLVRPSDVLGQGEGRSDVAVAWSVVGRSDITGTLRADLTQALRSMCVQDALDDMLLSVAATSRDGALEWSSRTGTFARPKPATAPAAVQLGPTPVPAAVSFIAPACTPVPLTLRASAPWARPLELTLAVEARGDGAALAGKAVSLVRVGGGEAQEVQLELMLFAAGEHHVVFRVEDTQGRSIEHACRFVCEYV